MSHPERCMQGHHHSIILTASSFFPFFGWARITRATLTPHTHTLSKEKPGCAGANTTAFNFIPDFSELARLLDWKGCPWLLLQRVMPLKCLSSSRWKAGQKGRTRKKWRAEEYRRLTAKSMLLVVLWVKRGTICVSLQNRKLTFYMEI